VGQVRIPRLVSVICVMKVSEDINCYGGPQCNVSSLAGESPGSPISPTCAFIPVIVGESHLVESEKESGESFFAITDVNLSLRVLVLRVRPLNSSKMTEKVNTRGPFDQKSVTQGN